MKRKIKFKKIRFIIKKITNIGIYDKDDNYYLLLKKKEKKIKMKMNKINN